MAERGKCIDGKPHWDVRRGLRLRCKICGKFKPKQKPSCSRVSTGRTALGVATLGAQTVQSYDAHAPALAAKFDEIGPRVADVARAFSLVKKSGNPRVIELGCGNGRDAEEILKFTSDYTGADASAGMIALAHGRLPQANFQVSRMEDFQFPSEVDMVFAFASLLHLDKEAVGEILSRVRDALKPGGLFYISVKRASYSMKIKEDEFGSRAFYFYDEDAIKEMIWHAGYTLEYQDVQILGKTEWLTVALRPSLRFGRFWQEFPISS